MKFNPKPNSGDYSPIQPTTNPKKPGLTQSIPSDKQSQRRPNPVESNSTQFKQMKMERFLSKTEARYILNECGKVAYYFPLPCISLSFSAQSQLKTDPIVCSNPKIYIWGAGARFSVENSQNGNSFAPLILQSSNTRIFRKSFETCVHQPRLLLNELQGRTRV